MNNQYVIPLFVAGSLLLTLFAFFLIAYLIVQKNKQNAYQLERSRMELERKQMEFDHKKNLLTATIEMQDTTMDKISRELHDSVKSDLVYAQMKVRKLEDLATNASQKDVGKEAEETIEKVINELRNISHLLNPNLVRRQGLIDSLEKELEQLRESKNIDATLDLVGDWFSFQPEREVHVFRIAQEAIQNCMKHAKATSINFTLSYEPDLFVMEITDNGKGFEKSEVSDMKGLGMLNMYQRAKLVDGNIEIVTAPQKGCTITLTLNPNDNGVSS